MQKWEYRTIEVIKGRVNQVNGQLSYKVLPKGLSSGQPYTIDEYLSVIGEEGWEIVGCGTKALLYCTSSEHLGQMGQFAKVRFPSS